MKCEYYYDVSTGKVYIAYSVTDSVNGNASYKKTVSAYTLGSIIGSVTAYIEAGSPTFSIDMDVNDFIYFFTDPDLKLYVDGANKLKWEERLNDRSISHCVLLLNDNNTYQWKYECRVAATVSGANVNALESFELLPTTKKVTMPNPDDYKD